MNLSLLVNKVGFWGRKHSPELLISCGIVLAAASIVSSVIATRKLDKTVAPFNVKIDEIKKNMNDENGIQNKTVDIKICKKELTKTYLKAGLKVGALYAPSLLLFGASVSCILGSHNIMKSRNLALTAACATLDKSYKEYRKRVKDKIGEEAEEKLYKDIHKDEIEVVDPKTGEVIKKKANVPHVKEDHDWNVMYDCGNNCWGRDALQNFDWLMMQQTYLTEKLRRRGYLFLHEVYDTLGCTTAQLGAKKARASRILGWIYDPSNPNRNCYVSFGLTQPGTLIPLPEVAEQIQRNEPAFFLTLNPDGDILSGENGKETYMKFAKEWA